MVCLGLCHFVKAFILSYQRSVGLSLGSCPLTFVIHSLIQQISASSNEPFHSMAYDNSPSSNSYGVPTVLGTVPGID